MGEWYVLVEENKGWSDSNWLLKKKVHVEGGREQALARAEELSLSYVQDLWRAEEYGRLVFRTSETSWLLELSRESWDSDRDEPYTFTEYARLSVAELVASKERPPAQRPASKKGVLRRALGRD
ncbi:hypothetical protein [Streptomyces canus]|uniref:hypothetical protein n=1 Tax=Streptomyces canus TaxID=58343 RepID=UPI000749FD4B|nr:hypothetical protein [Streptomyces canus]KUN12066.1 hypothetical protein AQI96_16020 [Streptomyces canus]